jgi:hypothetical protein
MFFNEHWPGRYILDDDGEPVLCPNIIEWAAWMETADRIILRDTIGDSDISTVFLGLDHSFGHHGPPILFETMIFGGPCNDECWRYTTKLEALEGHAAAMRQVEETIETINQERKT